MNRKQLTTLVIACAILGVVGWIVYNERNSDEGTGTQGGQKLIKNFPLNDVERVAIRQGNGQVNLVKQNDIWTVQERNNYPANFSTISEFLRKVWELKVTRPQQVGQSQLGRLELLPPDKGGTNSGTLVEFKEKSGKNINSLLLGKKHMRKSENDNSGF